MNEWKKIIIVFSIISVLSCVSIFMIYQEKNDFEKQYYQLVDLESTENGSLRQLLNQDDLLTRLNAFNEDLRKSEQFTFIEFLPNVVEIIGEWDKPVELVDGYEYGDDLRNQTVSSVSYTHLDVYKRQPLFDLCFLLRHLYTYALQYTAICLKIICWLWFVYS